MDEQLEQPIERGGAEAQIEEVLSPAGEEAAKETAGPEAEINTESSAEETKIPDAELSTSEGEDNTSSTADAVRQAGNVARQVARRDPPHEGRVEEVPRNYYAEWQELAEAHPEVVGKELPEDIYQACMRSELPPLRVYESMMLQKQNEQIAALQQEIATLRQNAENTARAPVSAAAGGPDSEPEDLFLKGFNSY